MVAGPALAATEATVEGDQIVVTATRSEKLLLDTPAAISVQPMDELRRMGFSYGTDEFRGVPGVFFRRGEGDGDTFPFVAIRGSVGTDGFLALIDGIPFQGFLEEPLLSDVPYGALDRVEVVRGPLSALYGRGALYGAVNYITRPAREDRTQAALTGGSYDFWLGQALVSKKLGENAGLVVSGQYEDSRGWREQFNRKAWQIFAKLDADFGERTRMVAMGQYLDRNFEAPNGIPLDRNGNLVEIAGGRRGFFGYLEPFNRSRGGFGALRFEHEANDKLSFAVTGQYRRYSGRTFFNFFDPFGTALAADIVGFNGFRGQNQQRVWFGEATARWQPGGGHNIIAGASIEDSQTRNFDRWSGQNGFTFACGFNFYLVAVDVRTGNVTNRNDPCFEIDTPLTDARTDQKFAGLFIQDEWNITDTLTLTAGLRYDDFRRTTRFLPLPSVGPGGAQRLQSDAVSPRLSLSWKTDAGLAYASYSRGFNSNFGPTFENNPRQYARPTLVPTTLDSYEIGLKGQTGDGVLRYELAAFYSEQANRRIIVPNPAAEADPGAPRSLITFGDNLSIRGIEVALGLRPAKGTQLQVNYSHVAGNWDRFTLSTFAGPVDLSGRAPVGVPKNTLFVSADQAITSWMSARAQLEVYDDYPVTLDNRVVAGGYEQVTLNLRIAPPMWRGVTVDFTMLNAFGTEYDFLFGGRTDPTYATPGPPQQFRATIAKTF